MLDALRQFLLIVEHGTFTEAARRAHRTQPALSAGLRKLEDELGSRLLHRGPAGARPTAAGEALIPHARAALAAVEAGREAVADVAGLRSGSVRLGAGPTACTYLLPALLASYRAQHPGVRFFLRESHTPRVWDGLHAGELDLGLVSEFGGHPGFCFEACLRDELVVCGAPGGDPAAPWVTFPRGSGLRAVLDRVFAQPEVVMELGSIAAVKGNVRAGIGRCLVSRAAVQRDLADGSLVVLPDPRTPVERTFWLVHRGAELLPPAAARLRQVLLGAADADGAPG